MQSKTYPQRRRLSFIEALGGLLLLFTAYACGQSARGTAVPILLPAGVAFDLSGNLFISEATGNRILRLSPDGTLTILAGTGVQGYAGDGGAAQDALLDTPTGLVTDSSGNLFVADTHNNVIRRIENATGTISRYAGTGYPGLGADGAVAVQAAMNGPTFLTLDAQQNLYFSDTRNHLIRRIDAKSGLITTVAGNGVQGFSGDLGPAVQASIDTPTGLALDAQGNLFVADSHNQRVRRIDASSGQISTIAGTGKAAYSGDSAPASSANLHLPAGLTIDGSGNLFLADAANHRIRRIDSVTAQITTVAGEGTQAYAGDEHAASSASLNTPRAVALSPTSLVTLADSANLRVRQVDSGQIIHTLAGLGTTVSGVLTLSSPSTISYGTGTVRARLAASPATGSVTLFEGTLSILASTALAANEADFPTSSLSVGSHHLSAIYSGDADHSAAQSPIFSLNVTSASLGVTPHPVALLYGQLIPPLTDDLVGLLPQDASTVLIELNTTATSTSDPGDYPIVAALTGPAAGNYALEQTPAFISIAKAPVTVSLSASGYIVHTFSTTRGTPSGTVTLLDGQTVIETASLDSSGSAIFNAPNLVSGTHTLSALYPGNKDFLLQASAPVVVTIDPAMAPDFQLIATGQTTLTVPAGNLATFSFAVTPINGALASAEQLTVSGLPQGATASFNPAYLPPSAQATAFLLTIQTNKTVGHSSSVFGSQGIVLVAMLLFLGVPGRQRKRFLIAIVSIGAFSLIACGDRINAGTTTATPQRTYNITVTCTATGTNSSVLSHSAGVTLVLQ